MAVCAAASTGAGVGKSGSPISMWTTVRPAASSARAAVCTSITWKGSMPATRAAVAKRVSIEGTSPCGQEKRYGNALSAAPAAVRSSPRCLPPTVSRTTGSCGPRSRRGRSSRSLAHADVYKCAGEGGIPVYQEMPCGAGKELRNFQTDPPEITVLPAQRATTASRRSEEPRDPRCQAGQRRQVRETGETRAAMPASASTRTSA